MQALRIRKSSRRKWWGAWESISHSSRVIKQSALVIVSRLAKWRVLPSVVELTRWRLNERERSWERRESLLAMKEIKWEMLGGLLSSLVSSRACGFITFFSLLFSGLVTAAQLLELSRLESVGLRLITWRKVFPYQINRMVKSLVILFQVLRCGRPLFESWTF